MDDLLGDLALHRLDIVIADAAPPPNPNIRLYTHALGSSPLAWYAPPHWESEARRGFPQSLARVPVLLPTPHGALRARLADARALGDWLVDGFYQKDLLLTKMVEQT